MPNLSDKETHKYWHSFHDPMVYKIIVFMESVEIWPTEDNAELEKSLDQLGTALDQIGYIDLQEEAKIIQLANSLKMGRMLRLLQSMDTAHPGAATKIIMFAKNASEAGDESAKIFIRRNVIFERLRILSRVFAKNRLDNVVNAIGKTDHA